MSKEIEKRIEELEGMKAERERNIAEFKKDTKAKIDELTRKIDGSMDPFEAVKLNRERQDLKDGLELFNKKNADKRPIMDAGELNRTLRQLDAEIEDLKDERQAEILEAYHAFEAVMDKYADEAEALEALKNRASRIGSNGPFSVSYRANLFDKYDEAEPGISYIIGNYFNRRAERAKARRW